MNTTYQFLNIIHKNTNRIERAGNKTELREITAFYITLCWRKMMSKNVCFLITEHPFLDARIFKKEAKSLHGEGYQVTMIVPTKNGYLFDVDGSIFHQQFRSQTFIHEGIKIVTYEQMYPENQLKNLHYNLHSGHHSRFTDPLTQLGIAQQADIYHAHEFFSLYSGVGIKRTLATKGRECKL